MTIVVLFAIVIGAAAFSTYQKEAKQATEWETATYTWPTSGLAALLPQPESEYGEVELYSDNSLRIEVRKTDMGAYGNYVEACKEKGFTEEATSYSTSYKAYDKDGNRLNISFRENSSKPYMDIDLDAAREMSSIAWPTSGVATGVPAPESLLGDIATDNTDSFSAYLSMDKDTYAQYVETCSAAGFDVDSNRSETSYSATNADGVSLSVSYQGGGVAHLTVKAAEQQADDKDEAVATGDAAQTDATNEAQGSDEQASGQTTASDAISAVANLVSDVTSGAVTPEFKEFVDGYESFMNSYCDFMVKYTQAQAAGDTSSMLADYTSLVQQELEWVDKMNAVDQSGLSSADLAYYTAATARVEKRLIEIGTSAS